MIAEKMHTPFLKRAPIAAAGDLFRWLVLGTDVRLAG